MVVRRGRRDGGANHREVDAIPVGRDLPLSLGTLSFVLGLAPGSWMDNQDNARYWNGFMAWFADNSDWFEKESDQLITYEIIEARERRYSNPRPHPFGWHDAHDVPIGNTYRPLWDEKRVYEIYFWIRTYPEISTLLKPFTNSRFTDSWRAKLLPNGSDWQIRHIKSTLDGYELGHDRRRLWRTDENAVYHNVSSLMLRATVCKEMLNFLQIHQESGFVMLAFLRMAFDAGWYEFLQIDRLEPIELYRIARKIANFMRRLGGEAWP